MTDEIAGRNDLHSETIIELTKALSIVQGQMVAAQRNATNPFYKSSYADLETVWQACRKPLASNGLAITQLTAIEDGGHVLVTLLMHVSGEWLRSTLRISPTKANDPQAIGSAITYARRYALAAMVGVVVEGEDDDGEAATGKPAAQRERPPRRAEKPVATSEGKPGDAMKRDADDLFRPESIEGGNKAEPIGNLRDFMTWAQELYGYGDRDSLCQAMGVEKPVEILQQHRTWGLAMAYLTSKHARHAPVRGLGDTAGTEPDAEEEGAH